MASFYTNENIPRPVAEKLRTLGHDVLTVAESGNSGQAFSDVDVLDFARRQGRILVTLNRRHFVRLHMDGVAHAGIIVCTVDTDFQRQAQTISAAVQDNPDLKEKLIRINRPQQ